VIRLNRNNGNQLLADYPDPAEELSIRRLTVALVFLYSCLVTAYADDDESAKSSQQQPRFSSILVMDENAQASLGLKTRIVSSVRHQAEFEVVGKVVSFEPLLALRERYLVAQAELSGAKARLKQAGQNLERQKGLFQNGVVAKRFLQDQETQALSDQAIVDAGQVRLMKIMNEARLLWGSELAKLVLMPQAQKLEGFLSGQEKLLQIILPSNKQLDDKVEMIAVEPNGNRSQAYSAKLLSRSGQVDNSTPGESYFFLISEDRLRIGMKVSAWIPESSEKVSGIIVPESALIWYMDQEYVYIKNSSDKFTRRTIKSFSKIPEGYLIAKGLAEGEEVVITGGQMLLSTELRGQIPEED
jgi:hypothetical protein